jgi:ABC-2 type transport system ATP-binding protein
MMSDPVLRFDDVTRRFGAKLALDRVSFDLEPGKVLGLVGRNGAGKTTALRLAQGLLHADAGRISVVGRDPVTEGLAVREQATLMSEEAALYPWMTVREILSFGSALHPAWDDALAQRLLHRLDVPPDDPIRSLSRGTRAKVALILAVAPRPKLLLLDDPTAGLDPLARREVLEGVLDSVSDEGGAVVYASHLVHDLERVADDLVVLDAARITLAGPLDAIKAGIKRATAVFETEPPAAREIPGAIETRAEGRVLTVLARAENGDLEAALTRLGAGRVEVETLNLEEILVALLRNKTAIEEADHV